MRSFRVPACAVLVAAVLAVLAASCQPQNNLPELSLEPTIENEVLPDQLDTTTGATARRSLHLAISPIVSPLKSRVHNQLLFDYLSARLDNPLDIFMGSTYTEVNELLRQVAMDIAFSSSWAYVQGREDFGLELLAVPQIKNSTDYRSYIIVDAASDIYTLADLYGKRFAYTDPLSFSGRLYVVYRLFEMGENPDDFFSESIYTYSHDNSVIAVTEGLVTGAAVQSLIYEQLLDDNPELRDKIKVIEESPGVGNPPVVARPGLDPGVRQKIKDIFLAMHEDAEGRQVLEAMGIDRFLPGNDSRYQYVRDIVAAMKGSH